MAKTLLAVPDVPAGLFDTPGSFTVLTAVRGTLRRNLAINPSAELSNTAGWVQGGTFPADTEYPQRSTARSWIGTASFKMESNSAVNLYEQVGFFFTPQELGRHCVSVYFKKTGNLDLFEINVDDIVNPMYLTSQEFNHSSATESDWFRWSYVFDVKTLTPKKVRFRGTAYASGENFVGYLDGILVEKAGGPGEYFDGATAGAMWEGAAHNSISVQNYEPHALTEFGFTATAIVGGNAPLWNTISTPYANGGAFYQRSTPGVTEISIVGILQSKSGRVELEQYRNRLVRAFSPRAGIPVQLLYQPATCKNPDDFSTAVLIEGVYTGGLEGNLTNDYLESVAINLRVHTPYVARQAELQYQALTMSQTFAVPTGIVKRAANGEYSTMPSVSPYNGMGVALLQPGPSGQLFAVLSNGVNDKRLVMFDEDNQTVVQLGAFTATSSSPEPCEIQQIRFDRSGDLWVCGQFNAINGSTKNNLAKYSGGVWTSPITSITEGYFFGVPRVSDIVFCPNGRIFVGGNFNNINGLACKNFVEYTDGTLYDFTDVTGGINGASGDTVPPYIKFAVDNRSNIYIYGRFSGRLADTTRNFWRYKTSYPATFYPLGDVGASNSEEILKIQLLQDGTVFLIGTFTEIDGVDCLNYATFNGGAGFYRVPTLEAWTPPTGIAQTPDGIIHIAYPTSDFFDGGWHQWNGSVLLRSEWQPNRDIYIPSLGGSFAEIVNSGANLYFYGVTSGGDADVPYTNIITNEGDSDAYPEFFFSGILSLNAITNFTTGKRIMFDETYLAQGETATLRFYPQLEFTSNLNGDLRGLILPGSNVRDFVLVPGENRINIGGGDPSVTPGGETSVTWRNTFDSMSAALDL